MELQKINKGGLIMEKKLSIITGNIEKGGTGKTTTIYNLGGYAVENLGMKVLYMMKISRKTYQNDFLMLSVKRKERIQSIIYIFMDQLNL